MDELRGLARAFVLAVLLLAALLVGMLVGWGVAHAAPLVHVGPQFRWFVGSDPHLDYDLRQGQNTAALAFGAAASFSADGAVLLGDLYGARSSDLDGDREWDCTVDRIWSTTCEYPSDALGARYRAAADLWDPARTRPLEVVDGNHDGPPSIPELPAHATPDAWRRRWFPTANGPCSVDDGREYHRCDVLVVDGATSAAWTLLLLHDQTAHQDRAIGGRCDLRDYDGLTALRLGCSTRGWPVGVVTPYQLEWLEAQVALAQLEGRRVVVGTHQPVPDTVALSGPGASYVPQCAQGILVQTPPPGVHHNPRDADLLPARTDLDAPIPGDGRTPLQVAAEEAGVVLRWYPGAPPDRSWGLDLVRRYPGTVLVWLSGHNHLPVPDLVDHQGRGAVYRDPPSGTAFLALGAITRWWVTTSGTGHPQAALLDLRADGTWAWTRLALQTHGAGLAAHGCGGAAKLPPTRPAPWVDLPVEVGP